MLDCHQWQRMQCQHSITPILNVACKEDPAQLGKDFGATNLDLLTFDPHTGVDMTKLPNFVHGDAKALPFGEKHFGAVVLGEILEHCKEEPARKILAEAKRVLRDDGWILVTFPLDNRAPEEQHAKHLLVEWDDGITSWHQSVWDDTKLNPLLSELQLKVVHREMLTYQFLPGVSPQGWGLILRKEGENPTV